MSQGSEEDVTEDTQFDLIVIGGGPGGYVAAIRAAQLGLSVALIEKERQLGGTCLRVGCIPSKALLESSELFHQAREEFSAHGIEAEARLDLERMQARKQATVDGLAKGIEGLMKKNGVRRFTGHGRFLAPTRVAVEGDEPHELEAERVLIATGSSVARLKGVELDGDRIGTSTEALAYPRVPEHLTVIGAGAIGLELGSVWKRLGAKVTVLEYADRVLPGMDRDLSQKAKRVFAKQGLKIQLGARVTGASVHGERCWLEVEGQEPIECDRVLVAVGRVPNTEGLGLDSIGLELDERGRVPIDDHFRTPIEGVFAIGDAVRGPMLAHKAEDEGLAAAEYMATGRGHVNYDAIPNVVYTAPEIASVGKSEDELEEAGIPFRAGRFAFAANGRARALGQTQGFAKVLAHAETDRILGVHILGPRAGDLIAEAAVAIEFHASAEDLARSSHAHPTLAEVLKEAALAVDGRAIHS